MIQSRLPSVGQCRSVDRVGAGQTDTWQLLGFRGTIHSLTVVTLKKRRHLIEKRQLSRERLSRLGNGELLERMQVKPKLMILTFVAQFVSFKTNKNQSETNPCHGCHTSN